jgi:hypothetical protein
MASVDLSEPHAVVVEESHDADNGYVDTVRNIVTDSSLVDDNDRSFLNTTTNNNNNASFLARHSLLSPLSNYATPMHTGVFGISFFALFSNESGCLSISSTTSIASTTAVCHKCKYNNSDNNSDNNNNDDDDNNNQHSSRR